MFSMEMNNWEWWKVKRRVENISPLSGKITQLRDDGNLSVCDDNRGHKLAWRLQRWLQSMNYFRSSSPSPPLYFFVPPRASSVWVFVSGCAVGCCHKTDFFFTDFFLNSRT